MNDYIIIEKSCGKRSVIDGARELPKVNVAEWPHKVSAKDLYREFTFKERNERACRLANALADMGMKKGGRFTALERRQVRSIGKHGHFVE